MFNIYESLFSSENSSEGIQDIEVLLDTVIINSKIRNSTDFLNIVIVEKIFTDYEQSLITNPKSGIVINFGNTETDLPLQSTGNIYLKSFLDNKNKFIYIIGLKNTMPIIYKYDVNVHSCNIILDLSYNTIGVLDSAKGYFTGMIDYLIKIAYISDNKLYIFEILLEPSMMINSYEVTDIPSTIKVLSINGNDVIISAEDVVSSITYK